ncbi:MAG: diguanylate cyclase [Kiritimatiellae bacterium]|nr:diguanylate cyclase [Kiritimatiellia bacterium]
MSAENSALQRFRSSLWSRTNAFTVGLRRLSEDDPAAAAMLKELARSLAAAAADAGLEHVQTSAKQLVNASDDALARAAQEVLELLRNEAVHGDSLPLPLPAFRSRLPGLPVSPPLTSSDRSREYCLAAGPRLIGPDEFRVAFEQMVRQCATEKLPVALGLLAVGPAGPHLSHAGAMTEALANRTAVLLSSVLRPTDLISHIGSSEFAILFPGEDAFGAMRALQKATTAVEGILREIAQGRDISLSCAAGLTTIEGSQPFDSALAATRTCLEEARAAGGGQVVTHDIPQGKQKMCLLIVGGNDVVTRVLKGVFEKEGYETEQTTTMAGAQTLVTTRSCNAIVVLDPLPDGNATMLAETFRAIPGYARTPIVAVLEDKNPERIARALESGVSDYATRPFSPQTILLTVKQLMTKGVMLNRPAPQTRRLLFVDNDVKNLLLAGSAIHYKGGFVVYLALGLSQALARLDSVEPDVVVVPYEEDVPLLSVLAERLAERGGGLIFSVPEGAKPSLKGLVANVAKGVITKPFTPGKLLEQMGRLCPADAGVNIPPPPPEHLNAEIHRILQETTGGHLPGRAPGGVQK